MSAVILPPSGEPFEIVGTDAAKGAISKLEDIADDHANNGEERKSAWDGSAMLYCVLAHRDHLFHQVTELQAFNTETLLGVRRYKRAVAAVLDMADDIDGSTFTAREVTRAIASALAPDGDSPAPTVETSTIEADGEEQSLLAGVAKLVAARIKWCSDEVSHSAELETAAQFKMLAAIDALAARVKRIERARREAPVFVEPAKCPYCQKGVAIVGECHSGEGYVRGPCVDCNGTGRAPTTTGSES